MSELVIGMGVVSSILLVAALVSGVVERAPLSFPMIFLGLGFLLGGLDVIHIDSHDMTLEIVATVSLALVLFLDAVEVQIDELKREWYVPMLTLGPGTLLTIGGVAGASHLLLGTSAVESLLLGAILSSTDPVVLRDIVRDERIPRSVRRALSVEAGMNDIVVLPIVLILIAVLTEQVGGAAEWVGFLLRVLVVSPLIGLFVGGIGAYLIGKADARYNIRKEYQALYGIGLVLAAWATGQAVEGDGFLAAFFAGLAITLFNVSLCECFMDYGEVTAEMMMLLAFVLFGVVLWELFGTLSLVAPLILAVIGLGLVRPLAMGLVLQNARMSNTARAFVGWFGPRGLNSLLLALLAVQASVPDAEWLLAVTGVVVTVSVLVHGASATPLASWYGHRVAESQITFQEEREGTFTGLFEDAPVSIPFIKADELAERMKQPEPLVILDVRARAHYEQEAGRIPGAVRVLPDLVGDWADDHPRDAEVVTYCSCPEDATSARVARLLQEKGFRVSVLQGGYPAWRDKYPIEAKGEASDLIMVGEMGM